MTQDQVQLIPVDQITVINPRVRNKKIFREIVDNIAEIGLKRPITVTPRQEAGTTRYDLVCGQGRLEAYQALGQREIPALVIKAETQDCLVMSLVENLARRQHRSIDLLHDIDALKKRGYRDSEIAPKVGLTVEYVRGVLRLLKSAEHRLLRAVEAGQIPVSVAVEIAEADDTEIQNVLQQAYESKQLRGQKLVAVKRLVAQRKLKGKGRASGPRKSFSVERLMRTYRDDTDKKRLIVKKAEATQACLVFVTEALRTLFADEHFVTLLRAEGLGTLPANLHQRINPNGVS